MQQSVRMSHGMGAVVRSCCQRRSSVCSVLSTVPTSSIPCNNILFAPRLIRVAAPTTQRQRERSDGVTCNATAAGNAFVFASVSATENKSSFPTWLAVVRATLFYLTTFLFAAPLFVVMLAIYPIVMLMDKFRRRGEHVVNNIWAKLTTLFYYPVKISGLENLPPADQPAVFISNHLSFLDIYTLFHLNRDFKFISKTSNFLIPIIGWSMFLTGHVMINRVDRRSQLECLKACGELLKKGASVLFFPEGTRSKDGKMHAFKKGAFSVAAKAKVPVVPITLLGTGDLMPNKKEYLLYPGKVEVVIHPQVPAADADTMMAAAYKAVASCLPADKIAIDTDGQAVEQSGDAE